MCFLSSQDCNKILLINRNVYYALCKVNVFSNIAFNLRTVLKIKLAVGQMRLFF